MRSIWTIFKRELRAYFSSPVAYAVIVVFLLLGGYFFSSLTAAFNLQSMQYLRNEANMGALNLSEMVIKPLFYNLNVIFLLMIPILTMRLYAEERKSGTIELLLTSPITPWQLTAGKFCAALALFSIMLALTLIYPLILFRFGNPDVGKIVSLYLGLFLVGAAYVAVGALTSALTENQIIAAVVSFGILLLFWVIGWASHFVEGAAGDIFAYLSIVEHFAEFVDGIIDTKHLVYYFSFIGFNLFLTKQALEMK